MERVPPKRSFAGKDFARITNKAFIPLFFVSPPVNIFLLNHCLEMLYWRSMNAAKLSQVARGITLQPLSGWYPELLKLRLNLAAFENQSKLVLGVVR